MGKVCVANKAAACPTAWRLDRISKLPDSTWTETLSVGSMSNTAQGVFLTQGGILARTTHQCREIGLSIYIIWIWENISNISNIEYRKGMSVQRTDDSGIPKSCPWRSLTSVHHHHYYYSSTWHSKVTTAWWVLLLAPMTDFNNPPTPPLIGRFLILIVFLGR